MTLKYFQLHEISSKDRNIFPINVVLFISVTYRYTDITLGKYVYEDFILYIEYSIDLDYIQILLYTGAKLDNK